MNTRNIIIADCETTGLDSRPGGSEVIQLAATALNPHNLDFHHAGHFHVLIKPQRPEKAQAKALEIIGPEMWEKVNKEGLEPKVAWREFYNYVDSLNPSRNFGTKPLMGGWNINFDIGFMVRDCHEYNLIGNDRQGMPNYPWSFAFDIMMMSFALFENSHDVANWKLDTILAKLGMARDTKTHDALADVILTAKIAQRGLSFLRKCNKNMKIMPASPTEFVS